ncbi:hypothetical protein GCM10009099_06530 [Caenispirillum bisanense]
MVLHHAVDDLLVADLAVDIKETHAEPQLVKIESNNVVLQAVCDDGQGHETAIAHLKSLFKGGQQMSGNKGAAASILLRGRRCDGRGVRIDPSTLQISQPRGQRSNQHVRGEALRIGIEVGQRRHDLPSACFLGAHHYTLQVGRFKRRIGTADGKS